MIRSGAGGGDVARDARGEGEWETMMVMMVMMMVMMVMMVMMMGARRPRLAVANAGARARSTRAERL